MIIDVLKEACQQVYSEVREIAGTKGSARKFGKGAGGDISRKIDLVAEKAVIDVVKKRGLEPTIIGEECGRMEGKKKNEFLIMDGIDGTTNAIRGIPFYCCSLAYSKGYNLSTIVDAAVIDLTTGNLYYASKGKGAFLNGRKIKVRQGEDLVIGMNVSGVAPDIVKQLSPVISKTNHARHFGANALELCFLARGFLDAFVDLRGKIRATDMAGAYLIVKEAGGEIYSPDGLKLDSDFSVETRISFVAASNNKIFEQLAADLQLKK